jgi:hypothetical protein
LSGWALICFFMMFTASACNGCWTVVVTVTPRVSMTSCVMPFAASSAMARS